MQRVEVEKKFFPGKTMRRLTRRVGMSRVCLRGSETSEEIARGYASIFKDNVDTRPSDLDHSSS